MINHGKVGIIRKNIENSPGYSGFACSHLTGKQHKCSSGLQSVGKMGESLIVTLTQIKILGIRRNRKRIFLQSVKFVIHAKPQILSAGSALFFVFSETGNFTAAGQFINAIQKNKISGYYSTYHHQPKENDPHVTFRPQSDSNRKITVHTSEDS
jgi:hypothetical protein